MKRFHLAVMFGLVALSSLPAKAATLVPIPNAMAGLTQDVHTNNAGSGPLLTLITLPGNYLVDVSTTIGSIDVGAGNGFAQVTGPTGPNSGFTNLTVASKSPLLGFSAAHFKIEALSTIGRNGSPARDFDLLVNFLGGGTQVFSNVILPANDKFLLTATGTEVITGFTFSDARLANGNSTRFRSLKQLSFNAVLAGNAVPEPGAWALMLAGFALAGAAMRRRVSNPIVLA